MEKQYCKVKRKYAPPKHPKGCGYNDELGVVCDPQPSGFGGALIECIRCTKTE